MASLVSYLWLNVVSLPLMRLWLFAMECGFVYYLTICAYLWLNVAATRRLATHIVAFCHGMLLGSLLELDIHIWLNVATHEFTMWLGLSACVYHVVRLAST